MSSNASINSDSDKSIDIELQSIQPTRPVERLFTWCLPSKKVPPVPLDSQRKPFPLFTSNPISRLLLIWVIPLLNVGYKRTIEHNDLWYLQDDLKLAKASAIFQSNLESLLSKNNGKYKRFIIMNALIMTYKWEFISLFLLRITANIILALNPLAVKYLISFVQERQTDPTLSINRGIMLSFIIPLMIIIGGVLGNFSFILSKFIGANSKTILTKSLLEKSFIANGKTKHEFNNGKLLSLFAGDFSRIDVAFGLIPTGLCTPISIIIAIVILIVNIGVSALVGIALFFIVVAILTSPTKYLMSFRIKANKFTDERISLMREILQSLKIIKFYSWEDAYEKNVIKIRNQEVHYLYILQAVINLISSLSVSSPAVVSLGSFLVLYAIRKDHNAAAIFSSVGLFNLLAQTSMTIPFTVSFAADAITALDRVTKYFESPIEEFGGDDYYNNDIIKDPKISVKIINGEFEWENFDDNNDHTTTNHNNQDSEEAVSNRIFNGLQNINLEIMKGELVVITGSIGSGKSSLLSAISGSMNKKSGDVGINGSILLSGTPWIQNTTIKENILFGSQFDHQRYIDVIKKCALDIDIAELPANDLTEIGERGVTLSGGQKARLSLARSIYTNKDIYLFDDILSAVDANVGKHIISHCLKDYLSEKTRIIATHQLSLISKADRVIFLNGDGTIDIGSEDKLRSRNAKFRALMIHQSELEETPKDRSKDHIDGNDDVDQQQDVPKKKKIETGVLYGLEERAINSIPFATYKQYFNAGTQGYSLIAFPVVIFTLAITSFAFLFTNVWLSFWVDNKFKNMSSGAYIGIYVLVTVVTVLLIIFQYALLGHIIVRASQVLNIQSMQRVLHTPMKFMDTTPVGRIMNRFSKDTNTLDSEIGENLKFFLHLTASSIGTIILAIIYLPWFAIAVPFLIFIYIAVANYYQATSREVKRIEAVTRSFIMNNFNEILNGMDTIKAYRSEERFLEKNNYFSDRLNEAYFAFIVNQRWVGLTLDSISATIVFIISLLSVTRKFNLSAASVGLLTSYTISLTSILSTLLRAYSEVENGMNSAERVCYYANSLEQEKPYRIAETTPNPNWPSNGEIEFKNVSLRYRENLPLVLKRLTFKVGHSAKIGICGRTGAGKSSITVALYRLVELNGGVIEIDGVDISRLGLHTLRSKLSIIPQDPTLFQGTIKRNLDPFNEHDDDILWDSLRRSGLIKADDLSRVKAQSSDSYHKFHLLSKVESDGSNFSVGERQLLALARALVRQSKILILDEATSSVDYETDSLVQKTIATEFEDCTILCIAHRLKTILNYDKILVLEKGEVEEFDEPLELYEKGGRFREMCESANLTRRDFST